MFVINVDFIFILIFVCDNNFIVLKIVYIIFIDVINGVGYIIFVKIIKI